MAFTQLRILTKEMKHLSYVMDSYALLTQVKIAVLSLSPSLSN